MKRLFGIVLLAMIFALIVNTLGMSTSTAHAAGNEGVSAEQLRNPVKGPILSPLMTPNTWYALGSGLNHVASTIVVNGTDIYAGGLFTNAGGDANADYIAKWDGTSWSALGTGLNGEVTSIVVRGTDIYVGGYFTDAGGDLNADYLAQWNGSTWSALGNGLNAPVRIVAVSGLNVYVAGNFTDAGGVANADYIAKLDGNTWESLGTTPLTGSVTTALAIGADVYVGGEFIDVGGNTNIDRIAKWDGTSWSALGSGLSNHVRVIVMREGEVYAGGDFVNAGGDANADYLAKWDGTSWSAIGGVHSFVRAITFSGTSMYIGGYFTNAGGNPNADYIAKWDGSSWSAVGSSLGNSVNAITINGSDIYVSGQFLDATGNANIDRIARFEVDVNAPTVNSFSATSPSSLNVPITAFTASDNVAVTCYLITESDTPPATGAAGWTASAPTTYTVASSGSYTLYPWVKDAAGNVSAVYGSPASVEVDASAPSVTSFTAPASSSSLNIPITNFTAADNVAVTGYLMTESSTPPSAGAAGWTGSVPTTYTVSSDGSYSLYPWAKDAAGNVSAVYGSPASVTVDATKPVVSTFAVPASSTSLNIPITTFSGSDNVAVTGFLITTSSTPPSAGAAGWTGSAPTTFTVGSQGSYTLYPWVKDALGNVSAVYGSPASVTVDTTKPTVNSFTATSPSTSFNVPITVFTASDNTAVSGYLITESSTPPSAGVAGWTGSAPTTYTVASNGSHTLYPWAKDAAGNVSAAYDSPASVTVTAEGWVTVGSAGFSAGTAGYPSLAIDNSTPYVAFKDGANSNKATVMKFDGTNWVTVGAAGFSAGGVDYMSLAFDNGTPYVVYQDGANSYKATVMKFDGTNWVTVGAAGFSADVVVFTSLAFDNGTPYVAFTDYVNGAKATVMKFDGANWVTVGSAGFSAGQAFSMSLAIDNGTPYVAYEDDTISGKTTVMKFDGANWVTVGSAGFSAGTANYPSLAINNGTPYVAYRDWGNSGKATVMKFDGANWVTVGAAGFSAGIVEYTYLAFDNGTPYVAYRDAANSNKATVMKFDGANWVPVGSAGFSAGAVVFTSLDFDNGTPYVAYRDAANSNKATVMKFIALPDTTAPTVDSFTAVSSSSSLDISITAFTASDDTGVTGYMITQTSTAPAANDAGWSTTAPTTYSVASNGSYTLYPWAKDAAGHVSAVYGSPASVTVESWENVGSAGFSAGEAYNTSLAFGNGTPYVAYVDAANSYKATVMKFDGTNWVPVGSAGFSAGEVEFTSLAIDNGTPYVAYQDRANSYKATVMKFDGANWVPVGSAGFSAGRADFASLAIDNGTPYVAFTDYANDLKVTVMKFDGANWVPVGSAGFSAGMAFLTSLTIDNGTPYVSYQDYGTGAKATVMKFDGANWVPVGSAGFSAGQAYFPFLAFDNGTPYVAYVDAANSNKATVMKFDGANWVPVGSAGFSAGMAGYPSLAINNGTPYVVYADAANSNKTTMMKFDGANWVPVGSAGFSAGEAYYPSLAFDNGMPYVAYGDRGNSGKTTVMKFFSDLTTPALNSITRQDPVASRTNADTLVFRANFSETVQNVDVTDFAVNGTTTATVTDVSSVGADPSVYDITVSGGDLADFEGIVGLDLSGSQDIQDLAGNSLPAGEPATDETYLLDQSLIVTKTEDTDDGACDSDCSLREAIDTATSGDTIIFDPSLSGGTIHLASTLVISQDLTIDGSSLASKITLSGDTDNTGTGDVRVLQTTSPDIFNRTITLDSLIVAKGYESEGAGLLVGEDTTVNIVNSLVTDNSASENGGALSNYGTAIITDSTFSGNSSAGNFGGGGAILNSQILTIDRSTFLNNTASGTGSGGALFNTAPTATITNSTFSGNSAAFAGGAITTTNNLTITNSTLWGNSAAYAGGISIQGWTTNLVNTIIANSTGADCINDATIGINTNNMIEDGSCSPALSGDPKLGPLQDNGGPTQTIAIDTSSLAINAGNDASCPAIDQRGAARPQGDHCDIGAYEYDYSQVHVVIGQSQVGSYELAAQESRRQSYLGVNDGPVKIVSTENVPIMAAERVIYKVNGVNTSFSEMMGLPDGQLDTTYWLPWYNNVDLDTQLRFGNVSGSTATVHVYIGGVEMTGSPFTLAPGASTRQSFAGINNGPVKIESDVPIVAAERVIYKVNNVNTSFTEMMALPNSQLDTTYWLPWYNNKDLDTQLRFGNVSNSTATVRVYIGGVEMTGSPFTLEPGASTRQSFVGINNGPVKIESDQPLVAAERVIYKVNNVNTSYSEMMALPNSQLDTTYWLPWYNNKDLDTQLRFGNVTGSTATVRVYIGGVEMTGSPFTLAPGASTRVSFAGVNSGPIEIVSDVAIVAAERVIYKVNNVNTSFIEMMALPNSQLDTIYWLPWYNNKDLDTQLRFGVP